MPYDNFSEQVTSTDIGCDAEGRLTGLGLNIACYLFLGGSGGGLCLVASILALLAPRGAVAADMRSLNGRSYRHVLHVTPAYRMLFGPLYACALVLLVMGCLFLIADLGVSNRAVLLFLDPRPTFITFGAFSLTACMLLCLALAAAWGLSLNYWRYRIVCALEVTAAIVGFAVVLYSGLLLSSVQAVPIWHSPTLPVLFAMSALSCGCAFALLISGFAGSYGVFLRTMRRVSAADVAVIVFETIVVAAFFATAFSSSYAVTGEGARLLLEGGLRGPFVIGFIGCGLIVPFALKLMELVAHRRLVSVELVSAISVLAGGFALRCCIVVVGAHPEVWV